MYLVIRYINSPEVLDGTSYRHATRSNRRTDTSPASSASFLLKLSNSCSYITPICNYPLQTAPGKNRSPPESSVTESFTSPLLH